MKDNLVHVAMRGKVRERIYFGDILEIIIDFFESFAIRAGLDVGEQEDAGPGCVDEESRSRWLVCGETLCYRDC